jgi:hypothetical protein
MQSNLARLGFANEFSYERASSWVLAKESRITVITADPTGHPQARALFELNQALEKSFKHHFYHTTLVRELDSKTAGSETLNTTWISQNTALVNSDFLVVAKLLELENHLNTRAELNEGLNLHSNMKFGRDKTLLQLLIIDAKSHDLLDQIDIKGQAAFFAGSQSLPMDLIETSLDKVLLELSGRAGV